MVSYRGSVSEGLTPVHSTVDLIDQECSSCKGTGKFLFLSFRESGLIIEQMGSGNNFPIQKQKLKYPWSTVFLHMVLLCLLIFAVANDKHGMKTAPLVAWKKDYITQTYFKSIELKGCKVKEKLSIL